MQVGVADAGHVDVPKREHSYTQPSTPTKDGGMAAWQRQPFGAGAEHVRVSRWVNKMTKCARCGLDIERPMKEWNMQPRNGRGPALHVKHYACPQCGKKFRVADKLAGA